MAAKGIEACGTSFSNGIAFNGIEAGGGWYCVQAGGTPPAQGAPPLAANGVQGFPARSSSGDARAGPNERAPATLP
jgi:hypothetical protein